MLTGVFITLLAALSMTFLWMPALPVPSVVAGQNEYRFVSTSCWFAIPWPEDIRCGKLHTAASTGQFVLPVVIIRDNSARRQPDPVLYLQGGPGGSAQLNSEGIQYWLNWRSYTGLGRDLILLDPRGVGRSRPALTCKAYDEFSLAVLERNTSVHDELAEGYEVLQQCFAQLRASSAFQVQHYGTGEHARDVLELMQLLHYENWNLLGVSYGTRVALEVANQSSSVRSLILDSVYPAGRGGVQSFPGILDQAVHNFFAWCLTDNACVAAHPDVKLSLTRTLKRLKIKPLTVTIPRVNGEVPVNLVVNDHRFLSAVFSALYNKHSWQKISVAITAVLADSEQGITPLMTSFINNALSDSFSSLVFAAVDCRDHPITAEADFQRELHRFPLLEEYTRDLWRYQACHFLDASHEPPVVGTSGLSAAVPALILAGELDPITPVQWARELHARWPESQLKILPASGHAVINSDECIHQSLREFLDAPHLAVKDCY